MARKLMILVAVFFLASCQSKQDRQWRETQTVLEITQGARP